MTLPIDSSSPRAPVSLPQPLPSIASAGQASLASIREALGQRTPEERRAWANSKDDRGKTPLAHAIEGHAPATNRMDVIAFLITECNADPNIGDNDNWTPLYRAATGTRSDAVQFLLAHGALPNICNKDGSTPLHRSVDRGCEQDVRTLLKFGANVDAMNCFGTPLHYAAKNGNIPIATLLLDARAQLNLATSPISPTPTKLAAMNGKEEMRALLASRGGTALMPSPLSLLVLQGDESAILQSFSKGEKDEYGLTVAHFCAHHGKVELMKQMRALGGLDILDANGRTPLHYAIIEGHEDMVSYMTSKEGDCALDSRDKQGYGPLMWACQYNRVTIARALLKRAGEKSMLQSILDISDEFGWRAIHKAAQVGSVDLVRMFVQEYKVDHMVLTSNNRTPRDLAVVTKAQAVIDYLDRLASKIPEGAQRV